MFARGYRKVWMALVFSGACVIALWLGLSGSDFNTLMLMIIAGCLGGNILENKSKPPTP